METQKWVIYSLCRVMEEELTNTSGPHLKVVS